MASAVAPGRGIPPRDVPPGPTSPRLDAYDDAETYALGSSDTGYLDSVAADATLGADMANARALRDAKAKSKRLPVKDVSTANNALRDMYEESFDFTDEQALARAAASYRFEREDPSPSVRVSDDRAENRENRENDELTGVFTLDERRASALESLRAKQRWKQAYVANAGVRDGPASARDARRSDLGDADKSEWIPHVFADGGGSVAWFKSRDAMTASERARADAMADRAEGFPKSDAFPRKRDAGERGERGERGGGGVFAREGRGGGERGERRLGRIRRAETLVARRFGCSGLFFLRGLLGVPPRAQRERCVRPRVHDLPVHPPPLRGCVLV